MIRSRVAMNVSLTLPSTSIAVLTIHLKQIVFPISLLLTLALVSFIGAEYLTFSNSSESTVSITPEF